MDKEQSLMSITDDNDFRILIKTLTKLYGRYYLKKVISYNKVKKCSWRMLFITGFIFFGEVYYKSHFSALQLSKVSINQCSVSIIS